MPLFYFAFLFGKLCDFLTQLVTYHVTQCIWCAWRFNHTISCGQVYLFGINGIVKNSRWVILRGTKK